MVSLRDDRKAIRSTSTVYTEFADIPRGYFGAILVDAPVRFDTWSDKGKGRSPEQHYPTMSWDEPRALDVAALAKPDSVLFVWVCWHSLPKYLELIERWGFTYKGSAFDWTKADVNQLDLLGDDDAEVQIGCGYWTRQNTEPCLLATRGRPHPLPTHTDIRQAIIAPRRKHSEKPREIHGRIERLVAGPFIELFARRQRQGWTVFGNQIAQRQEAAE
jgi:N6-adenosine-specific RNA methylase IME4